MTAISERQRARFYIYKKQKNCEMFLYYRDFTPSQRDREVR